MRYTISICAKIPCRFSRNKSPAIMGPCKVPDCQTPRTACIGNARHRHSRSTSVRQGVGGTLLNLATLV
jgi:hypothetical protein